jgi:hypothetical protein
MRFKTGWANVRSIVEPFVASKIKPPASRLIVNRPHGLLSHTELCRPPPYAKPMPAKRFARRAPPAKPLLGAAIAKDH